MKLTHTWDSAERLKIDMIDIVILAFCNTLIRLGMYAKVMQIYR